MPRRSSSPRSSPAPSRHVPAAAPAPPPPAPVYAQPQQRQPGLFAQMAATAGGVAVGSAIGHTVGAVVTGAMSGGGSREQQPAQQQQQPVQQTYQPPQQQYNQNPCFEQLQQFMECTQRSSDISVCQGFNDALRECKVRYGM